MATTSAYILAGFLTLWMIPSLVHSQDATVYFSVAEHRPNKTYLGSVALSSQLFSNMTNERFQRLQFQILTQGNKYASLFYIERKTSLLWTNTEIDREKLDECDSTCILTFNVAVFDLDLSELTTFIAILINIEDINDNAPKFYESELKLAVEESADVDYEILTGAAEDLDKGDDNSIQSYVMVPNSDVFQLQNVVVNDGVEFSIKLKNRLDRETASFYQFIVLAKDGGSKQKTGTLSIYLSVIDTNDNYPVFGNESYTTTITENPKLRRTVLLMYASDADDGDNGKVLYRFSNRVSNKINELFKINDTTGELTVSGIIDYETDQEFLIQVEAVDHGNPAMSTSVDVLVKVSDENDNYPQININQPPGGTVLPESAEISSFVAHVEITDLDSGDNGLVKCNILDDHFILESVQMKNNYKIVLNKLLDHDTNPSHMVNITCFDGGVPPKQSATNFIVHVEDENDNYPVFVESVFYATIPENNVKGVILLRVSATDLDSGRNGQVTYSLHPETKHLFIINSFTGIISINESLDRETHGEEIIFRVIANDSGEDPLSTTGSVVLTILDENDNDPTFTEDPIKLHVTENVNIPELIGNISASDPDKGQNGTFILSFPYDEEITEYFKFDSDGNILTKKSFDREKTNVYEFYIKAMDSGIPPRTSSVQVIVYVDDVNDNIPHIRYPNDYDNTKLVPYTSPTNSIVLMVAADDADAGENAKLIYHINQDNSSYLFMIGSSNGHVYLNNTLSENDIGTVFSLVIRVTDAGSPPLSSWTNINFKITRGEITSPEESDLQPNMWIVIAIVIVTVVLSIIMLVVIVKICLVNRNKRHSSGNSSSEVIVESNKVDPKLIPSSSSSSSTEKDKNGNEKEADMLQQVDESAINSMLTSLGKQLEEDMYIEKVRELGYEVSKKIDETNSDNSGEMGTRDSGQGGSDLDINSLSELPVLDISDSPTATHNSFLPSPEPGFHDNLNIRNSFHGNCNTFTSSDTSDNTTSGKLFVPKSTANFTYTPYKTAERKEIMKIRKGPKRVMFSDDLENSPTCSNSSGRSSSMSTFSYTDINNIINQYRPPPLHRLHSDDTQTRSGNHFKPQDHMRRSVDNFHWSDNKLLPSNNTLHSNRNVNPELGIKMFRNGSIDEIMDRNPSTVINLSPSTTSRDSTTTSGTYSLDDGSSSPGEAVCSKDVYV